jgi:2-amino-4-hydroxy-6-hydroxymethyldihydropteridine diphosphokinase
MPTTTALIMLGANHNALANLHSAIQRLRLYCDVLAVSSVYQSAAAGDTAGSAPYLNAAVKVSTDMLPAEFKFIVIRPIEGQLGRRRDSSAPPGQVPVDLDIVLWGDTSITYGNKPWRSPAPDILKYPFVALPLAEIAPDTLHPETGERLAEIAHRFADADIQNLGHLLDE